MQPHGLRSADGLVMPLYDMDGELWSVQLINGEGKRSSCLVAALRDASTQWARATAPP